MMLYILKLSVSLAVLWIFYQLLLRRLTFYNLNRWYLLGYSVLCFFIPLVDVGPALGPGDEIRVIRMIPVVAVAAPVSRPEWGIWDVVAVALAVGAGVLLVRLGMRWLSLAGLRRRSRLLAEDGPIRIYQVDGVIRPFSFGSAVYLNPELHSASELADIVLHEYVHIRQKHSVDILLAELFSVIGWYNPFVWLIRHSIRQNLEFIADRQVLSSGVDRRAYQYHLLNVVGRPAYRIANSFNFSSLKKRIVMMNKSRSVRLHLVKFLFVLPLLGVLLLAFRSGMPETVVKPMRHWVMPGAGRAAADMRGKQADMRGKQADMRRRGDIGKRMADTSKQDRDTTAFPARAIYLVDGKEVPAPGRNALLLPNIYLVEVYKGEEALALFGERGNYGVVAITTKAFHEKHKEGGDELARVVRDTPSSPMKMFFKGLQGGTAQPLFVVDGKESSEMPAGVTPEMIESVSVLKDAAAKAVYGDRGKNGVIIIVLKKKSSYVPRMTINGEDGPMSIMADTIRTNVNGKPVVITAEKLPGR